MTTDREQLIDSGYRLALWIAGRWARGRPQLADDLRQEACLALMVAATKFDPNHPRASWPGFVRSRVDYAILGFLSRLKKNQERFPEARPIVDLEDGTATQAVDLLPVDPSPLQEPERSYIAARAREAVAALPPRERDVVNRRYLAGDGATLEVVGNALGVSRERVRQLEQRALRALRDRLG